ncbi:MAG: AAA family ATPase, partial [Deltaproteobacteria bacterium]|nr:AAA family ATPase [Deltaproteobacteria bacterium]
MKLLPVGVADFQIISNNDYIYADKTNFLYSLLKLQRPYFLSRPRRFGKSLLVSALEAILRGRRELFKGLWIDQSDYDWQPYPVIHLSLSAVRTDSVATANDSLLSCVKSIAEVEGLSSIQESTPENFFKALILGLYTKYGQKPAILIDEYDAPILSKITEPSLAAGIRDTLNLFSSVLKDMEKYRGFTFITGVTKFAQTSIFSGLNNLADLTLNRRYANICGFTIDEFDTLFQDRLEESLEKLKEFGEIDQKDTVVDLRRKILEWYDGYSWDGRTRVLNPWSLLSFFDNLSFNNYWFDSGTPTFLVNLVKEKQLTFNYFRVNNFISYNLNKIELGKLNAIALMFQSGYLTVKTDIPLEGSIYNLVFPNLEVKAALFPLFLSFNNDIRKPLLMRRQAVAALACLFQRDSSGFKAAFESFLSHIPYEIHQAKEAFYHA